MGSKTAGSGGMPGGDVPAFDIPPTRTYTPEEWSATFGPNVEPNPRLIRQGPSTGGPMMPFLPGMGPGLGGQGPRPQMSPEDTIRMMYMTQLGRAPEQGGMDYWRQQLAGGMSPDQIRDAFRSSQEGQAYQQRMRPMTDDFGRGRQQMPSEVLDALRIALGGGRGRTYDPNAPRPYMGDPAAIEIAQRMGKNPNSPEVQDALRASRGLPVY